MRDRATKGLVALLDGDFETAARLVRHFHDVSTTHTFANVVMAACVRHRDAQYGCASNGSAGRGRLRRGLRRMVMRPCTYLLRDYARGVIERAVYLGTRRLDMLTVRESNRPTRATGRTFLTTPNSKRSSRARPIQLNQHPTLTRAQKDEIRFFSDVLGFLALRHRHKFQRRDPDSWLSVPLDKSKMAIMRLNS